LLEGPELPCPPTSTVTPPAARHSPRRDGTVTEAAGHACLPPRPAQPASHPSPGRSAGHRAPSHLLPSRLQVRRVSCPPVSPAAPALQPRPAPGPRRASGQGMLRGFTRFGTSGTRGRYESPGLRIVAHRAGCRSLLTYSRIFSPFVPSV